MSQIIICQWVDLIDYNSIASNELDWRIHFDMHVIRLRLRGSIQLITYGNEK